MTSPTLHVCTLCNREFDGSHQEPPRCPHCLRRVGVISVPAKVPTVRLRILPRLSPLAWTVCAAVVGLMTIGILIWQVRPAWFSGDSESDSSQADFCTDHRVQCPLDGPLSLPPELTALTNPGELTGPLVGVLEEHGTLHRPTSPPDRIRTASEVLEETGLQLIPIEAVALGWAAAQAANLDVVPCLPATQRASEQFWQRSYALCGSGCELLYSPLSSPGSGSDWKCLPEAQFTAQFIAAGGQLSLPAKEAYRLFAAARELHQDPDLHLHLGLVKVHNNAPEFGIEDMRAALQAGAAADGQLLLGDALLDVGLPADALDAFETLLRVAPGHAAGRLGKARALGLLGRGEAAATILGDLEKENSDLPGLWAAIGLTRRQSKDLDGAAQALRREITGNPLREHVATLVDLLLEQRKEEEAMTLLDTLYQKLHRADLALMAVQLTAATGKEDEAQERLISALANHGDNVELLQLSANWLLEKKDFGGAEEVLMRLHKRDPENIQVLVDLALTRFGLEKAGGHGARTARETVKELEKKSHRRVFQVAQVLSSWKYWDETEKIIEDRLAEHPGSRRTTAWLYFFYLSHDKTEKARQLRENPHSELDAEDLEWLKEAYGRIDERAAGKGAKEDE